MYAMCLPFLVKVYLPNGPDDGPPRYQEFIEKLLSLQADGNRTSQCHLTPPLDPNLTTAAYGRFESLTIKSPITDEILDISLYSMAYGGIAIKPQDRELFPGWRWMRPESGIVGQMGLSCAHKGIADLKGTFRMKRVWGPAKLQGEGDKTMELFEGILEFKVSFDEEHRALYRRNGDHYKYAFWAIRALEDESRHVGGRKKIDAV